MRTILVGLTAGILFGAGCSEEISAPPANNPAGVQLRQHALTAEMAKQALLEMDFAVTSRVEMPPSPPMDRPIKVIDADHISIGIYVCDLKNETFSASEFRPEAERHRSSYLTGRFVMRADGKWVALIEKIK